MGEDSNPPNDFAKHTASGADPAAKPDASPEAASGEVLPSLEDLLAQAEQKAADHHDAFLRAKAETENVRRRSETDVANARKYAVETLSSELLPVKDALEAALANANVSQESLQSGVQQTLKLLQSAFEKNKITEVDPLGQKFDPHRHQAISVMESDAEPNTVVMVLQKGYLLHDRVLRPALVTVAKQKSAGEAPAA